MKVIKIILFTIATLFTIYIITIFLLGYKIPQEDKHPEWPEFPKHSNPKIVVEEIKDFELKYGSKYRIPEPVRPIDEYSFTDYYKKNVINIKSVDFAVTKNEFILGSQFQLNLGGGNSFGDGKGYPTEFKSKGIEYFQITISNEKTFFKFKRSFLKYSRLSNFYQYNNLDDQNDTLFFRYFNKDYKAYIKH